MANVKKAILNALVDGALAELMVKTTADQVSLADGATLEAKIQEIATELAGKVDQEPGKGLSTEDFTTALKDKLDAIAAGAQVNVIETVKVNGTPQQVTDKGVDITVPTAVSELTNDSGYQTEAQVNAKISAVYKPGGSVAFASLPAADADHLGMVYNVTDGFTTTDDFVEGAGSTYPAGTNVAVVAMEGDAYGYDVLSGFVDLSGYVTKEEGKGLSQNDYTNEDKSKLAGIEAGAQVNVIESVKVNGAAQPVTEKGVDIAVPTGALASKDQVSETDLDEALQEKVNAAAEGNHSHANKTVLDGITQEKVTAWDGKSRVLVASEQPADLAAGDLWIQLIDVA